MKQSEWMIIYSRKGHGKESATVRGLTRKEARAYFWETLTLEEKNNEIKIISIEEIKE